MDIERSVIPHLVTPKGIGALYDQGIRTLHFEDDVLGQMYDYALEYFVKSDFAKAVPKELLESEFEDYLRRNEWPEDEYLPSVIADRLKAKFCRVQMQDTIRKMAAALGEDPFGSLRDGLTEMIRIQMETSDEERMVDYGSDFARRYEDYNRRVLENSEAAFRRGLPLGWDEVTEETFGLRPRELAIFVGFTGIGKSFALTQIARHCAERRTDAKVYFASLENDKELTEMRLDALVTGIPYRAYERGQLTRTQKALLQAARPVIEALKGRLLIDSPSRQEERTVFELYSRARYYGATLFVGDQLSWVTPRYHYKGDLYKETAEVIRDIGTMVRETGIPSVWAVQFNREAMRLRKGRGGLEHIALSSEIERIVDWAFSLSQSKDQRDDHVLLMEIIKARRSRRMAWLMDWELDHGTSLEVRREWIDERVGS